MKHRFLSFLLLPLLVMGCSKEEEEAKPTGPKEYQVEYRVTATNYTTADIIYRDNTETIQIESAAKLPSSYTFKRTMETGDVLSCGAFPKGVGSANGSATCAILLDGKEVVSNTETGTDPHPFASYVIP